MIKQIRFPPKKHPRYAFIEKKPHTHTSIHNLHANPFLLLHTGTHTLVLLIRHAPLPPAHSLETHTLHLVPNQPSKSQAIIRIDAHAFQIIEAREIESYYYHQVGQDEDGAFEVITLPCKTAGRRRGSRLPCPIGGR
jgi:hypothetical protein